MNAHERLEMRLKVLDLRLEPSGPHVDAEHIALIAGGEEPSAADAQHLAGCDECVELLVALGVGLERLMSEGVATSTLWVPPPPTPRRARRSLLVLGAMLVATAAAAATAVWWASPEAPTGAVEAPVEAPPPRSARPAPREASWISDISAPQAFFEPASAAGAPAGWTEASLAGPASAAGVPVASTEGRLPGAMPGEPASPGAMTASATAPASGAPAPGRPGGPNEPAGLEAGVASTDLGSEGEVAAGGEPLDTSLRGRTQHRLERQFVDGPPRGSGYLRLNSKPASRVFIDGKPHGTTPVVDLELPEGPHDVVLLFDSPLAAEPEQRFRVVIERDRTWSAIRRNLRLTPPE